MLPSQSHYHASFGLAREWETNGFVIFYTGTSQVKETIETQGYKYCNFDYLNEYFIASFQTFIAIFIKSWLDKSFFINRYRDFIESDRRIQELIKEVAPKHIFIDEHLVEYALFLQKNNIPTTIICTKLSSRKAKGIPPMNTYHKPDASFTSNLVCELLWYKRWVEIWTKKIILKIAFLGRDEAYFMHRYGKKIGIDTCKWLDVKNYHFAGIESLPRIILGTKKLEFSWRPVFDNETYFLKPTVRNEQKHMTDAYRALIDQIEVRRKTKRTQVLYCSFGTVSYKDMSRVQAFMEKLLAGKMANLDCFLVISKGKIPIQWPIIANVHYFDFIPQLDFLNYCDLMITHGGHNSIKECLQMNVPMLIYPHMENNDQPGNAVRVELNGFGLMGKITEDTSIQIWQKIEKLTGNNARYNLVETNTTHLFSDDFAR